VSGYLPLGLARRDKVQREDMPAILFGILVRVAVCFRTVEKPFMAFCPMLERNFFDKSGIMRLFSYKKPSFCTGF
jgi:hypothetical protein